MNATPLPLRLLTLAGAGALLLLSGCGATDTGTGGSESASSSSPAGGAASSATSTSSGNCANVASRTDNFNQKVTLTTTTADGLKYGDIVVGTGATAVAGDNVTMQYTGWLQNGTMFDTSRQAGRGPFEVDNLGQGQVIAGWNEGIQGMKLGGVRRLVIPPALAYGATGPPPAIPPNATLTFDVQLLCIGGSGGG